MIFFGIEVFHLTSFVWRSHQVGIDLIIGEVVSTTPISTDAC